MTGRKELRCRLYPFGSCEPLMFVVVCSFCQGKILLSRHKKRDTWETQGGHIEPGESPMEAARRELFEESGASDAELVPVCDYMGYDDEGFAYGAVFLADVRSMDALPDSEMREVRLFDELPEALTYPLVTPRLFEEARRVGEEMGIL